MIGKIRRFFTPNDFGGKALALGLVLGLAVPLLLYLVSRLLAWLGLAWDPLVWILLCWAVAGLVMGAALLLRLVEGSLARREDRGAGLSSSGKPAAECPHCGFSPLPPGARTCPNCHLAIR